MLMRVNGPMKLKRALELIQIMLEKMGAQAIENYETQDFYMPYEDTEALVEKGLIKDLSAEALLAELPADIEEEVAAAVEEANEEVPAIVAEEPTQAQEDSVSETDEDEDFEEENEETLTRGRDNIATVFGVRCVFKPYYDGYEADDVLAIPVSKDRFSKWKEKKQLKIFKRAEKKREKKLKK